MGPDGDLHTVNLKMVHSSVSDSMNGVRANPEAQEQQSTQARENFYSGFCSSTVNLYAGHSRLGKGPSFDAAKTLIQKNGSEKPESTNYDWYLNHSKDDQKMFEKISECSSKPAIIGLFSCVSDLHWGKSLRKLAPDSGLILSTKGANGELDRQFFDTQIAQVYTTLDSVLSQKCEDGFKASLDASSHAFKTVPAPVYRNLF